MCKRTMYKRARIPMFLWERRACANSGAQAVFPRPRKNGLGTRLALDMPPKAKVRIPQCTSCNTGTIMMMIMLQKKGGKGKEKKARRKQVVGDGLLHVTLSLDPHRSRQRWQLPEPR